jgi:hypothetical protein
MAAWVRDNQFKLGVGFLGTVPSEIFLLARFSSRTPPPLSTFNTTNVFQTISSSPENSMMIVRPACILVGKGTKCQNFALASGKFKGPTLLAPVERKALEAGEFLPCELRRVVAI